MNDHTLRLKRALVALQDLRGKLTALEQSRTEPIAIIGLGCRFPSAPSPEAYWQLLRNGTDAIRQMPKERWQINADYDSDPPVAGKRESCYGGFLDQLEDFDAEFFGMAPREAVSLDPQQRLLLEVTWEALEQAGLSPESLADSQTGVFIGISASGYLHTLSEFGPADIYQVTGNDSSTASGRLSYLLGLQGPNLAVNTACSSSLVAVHLAVTSLRNGECDLALAGGVNALLTSDVTTAFYQAGAIAADGRCKTFAATADGYVRSEGCGVVVLKRLSNALADGDNVLASIRGSALNQDGRTNGLTAPSGRAQQAVIRQALNNAGVAPAQISYVETHGTGTALGDPIEVNTLGAVFHEREQPLLLGAVKTNLGHLEAAAGMAGLIKVVLALQHGEIPPNLHFSTPNPHIPWEDLPVTVPTCLTLWRTGKRLAGVSAFGFSGTNAHVVLEEAPVPAPMPAAVERPWHLLALSAKTHAGLLELASRYADHLIQHPTLPPGDICFTANIGRSHFQHRLSAAAKSASELQSELRTVVEGKRSFQVAIGSALPARPKIAFLFTGQGSQYVDMGRQLYATNLLFRHLIDHCDKTLRPLLGESLRAVLYPESRQADNAEVCQANSTIDETAIAQPALFALEYALATLWQSWGIKPDIVLGHSTGEYAAACIAGVFSLEEGLQLIARRARLVQAVSSGGATAAVLASPARVTEVIALFADKVSLAGVNGPEETLISGSADAVDTVLSILKEAGITSRRLPILHASHSPLMDSVLDEFEQIARQVHYHAPRIKLISNVTGEPLYHIDAAYWRRHLREPVRFMAGIKQLEAESCQVMLEVGPQPVLLWLGRQNWSGSHQVSWLASLWPIHEDWEQLLQSLGELYVRGVEIDWKSFDRDYSRRKVILPTYPWQRQRYWLSKRTHRSEGVARAGGNSHPLLGKRIHCVAFQNNEILFETRLGADFPIYFSDHRVYEQVILPTTAYLEMALQAGAALLATEQLAIDNFAIHQALRLPEEGVGKTVQISLTPERSGYTCRIYAAIADSVPSAHPAAACSWNLHAEGYLRTADPLPLETMDLTALQAAVTEVIDVDEFYRISQERNLGYGSNFRLIRQLWRGASIALGRVRLPENLMQETTLYKLHPALADACLQVAGALFLEDEKTYLPIGVERLQWVSPPGMEVWCKARIRSRQQETITIDFSLGTTEGQLIASIQGLQIKPTTHQAILHQEAWHDWLYQIDWQVQARWSTPTESSPLASEHDRPEWLSGSDTQQVLNRHAKNSRWLIFADTQGISQALALLLRDRGEEPCLVLPGDHYEQIGKHTFRIDPTADADYRTLLDANPELSGIIHGWSLDFTVGGTATAPENLSAERLKAAAFAGCGTLLPLIQAMTDRIPLPSLWLVTQGAVACSEYPAAELNPALPGLPQSLLWGMANVIALEYPDVGCVQVDLDPQATAQEAAQALLEEMSAPRSGSIEEHVAFRHQVRHVARLTRLRLQHEDAPCSVKVRETGTYLITGGLGALGLLVAQWLVAQGAGQLVVMGRSKPKADAQRQLDALIQKGARVTIVQADVTDAEQVAAVISSIDAAYPLRGVIHAAGVLDDGALVNQSWARFTPVLAPKVEGAWHLHTLTRELALDFFILFSSAASLLGSAGQANHAAANAFLDALAHYRRSVGLPALAINWSAWSEVGQAARLVTQMQHSGMGAISPGQGVKLLEHLVAQPYAQIGVVPIDWSRFSSSSSFLRRFQQSKTAFQKDLILEKLAARNPDDRARLLLTHIQEQVAQILHYAGAALIPTTKHFREIGMDSLTSMELRNRLQSTLNCQLPAGTVFNYPTVTSLATYLALFLVPGNDDTRPPADRAVQPSDSPRVYPLPPPTAPLPIYERKLEVGGFTLNVCEWGADNDVLLVCVHGIMDHGASWEMVARSLVANGYRVIAPDLRGHGHSSHIGQSESYQLRDFIGDLDRILRQLDLNSVTLVGHSLGSMIATLYTNVRPGRISSLVLVEPMLPARAGLQTFADQIATHLSDMDRSPVDKARRHAIMANLGTAAECLRQVTPAMSEEMALQMAERLTQDQEGGLVWRWDARLNSPVERLYEGLAQEEYLTMLARIQVPITVVYGACGWLEQEEKKLLQTAIPNVRPVILHGGHSLHLEAPLELAEVICEAGNSKVIRPSKLAE
ncbi:MAG: alpha/beta fold hydrolase [Candidatus Competibacteraceae bacterium]